MIDNNGENHGNWKWREGKLNSKEVTRENILEQ